MFSNSPPNSWLSGVISRESLNMSFVTCMWWQRVDFCQKGKKRPKMCEVQPVFFPRVAHRGMESASDTSSVLETHDVITCARLNLAPPPGSSVQGSSLIFLPVGGIFPVVPFPVPAHFSTNQHLAYAQHHPCCAEFFGGLHTTVGSLLSAQTNTDRHKLSTIKVNA